MGWQEEMVKALEHAGKGEKNIVMARYASMTGKSPTHLYRIAKRNGYVSGRKKRCDNGKCALTELQIKFIAGLIYTTGRKNKKEIMSVKTALDIAEQNRVIEKGTVSVSRLQEILRDRGLNKKALRNKRSHMPMRSLHPNHVHLVDISVCIQYYLKNKELKIASEKAFYKNKFKNFTKVKQKIYRYVLTDHFSHTIFLKYYIAQGETVANLWDFLVSAWEPKPDPGAFPFRGVPFYLMMDKGAANTAGAIKNFLRKMDVGSVEGLPHNPRRQGSVERAQSFVEHNFESRLRLHPVHGIDELNDYAMDWCTFMNSHPMHIHTRFGTSRMACWMKIRKKQLRECPERSLLQELFTENVKERKVHGDYSIRFESNRYRIKHIPGIIPNISRVKVFKKPFSLPEIMVIFNGDEYLVRPIESVNGGFDQDAAVIGNGYKSMPRNKTETQVSEICNLAYGENPKPGDIPFVGLRVFGGQADRIVSEYIPRKSIPSKIMKAPVDDRRINMVDVLRELAQIRIVPPDLNRAIREQYGSSISVADRDALVAAMADARLEIDSKGGLRFTCDPPVRNRQTSHVS